MTVGIRAGMAIPMQILLAVLPAVTAAAPPPDSGKAAALRQAAAVPMTWQVERQTGAHSGRKSCVVFSLGMDQKLCTATRLPSLSRNTPM